MGDNLNKIVTFEIQRFVPYLWHVYYLGCPLLGGFNVKVMFLLQLHKVV